MSRRSRRTRTQSGPPPTLPDYVPEATRVVPTYATARTVHRPAVRLPVIISPRSVRDLWAFEDRRTYHPDPVRPARSLSKRAARIGLSLNAMGAQRPSAPRAKRGYGALPDLLRRASAVPFRIGFSGRSEALVCVRRHQRRAVMISKGVGSNKPRKWGPYSKLVCKRR